MRDSEPSQIRDTSLLGSDEDEPKNVKKDQRLAMRYGIDPNLYHDVDTGSISTLNMQENSIMSGLSVNDANINTNLQTMARLG